MPIYEFRCENNHLIELVMSFESSKGEVKCNVQYGDGSICNLVTVKQVSRVSMQPDSTWHTGVYSIALDKEFKNNKQMDDYIKDRGLSQAKKNSDITTMNSIERITKNVEKNRPVRDDLVHRGAKDVFEKINFNNRNDVSFKDNGDRGAIKAALESFM